MKRRGEAKSVVSRALLVLDDSVVIAGPTTTRMPLLVERKGAEWFEYVRGGLLSVGPSFHYCIPPVVRNG